MKTSTKYSPEVRDYNRQRRHSTLGHISPEAFEARLSA
jgi:transposase InsO family protein